MMLPHLKIHADAVLASLASVGATVGLATEAVPVPEGLPTWVAYLATTVTPLAIYVINRAAGVRAARKEARAAFNEARAKELLADSNPENDLQAAALAQEAAEDRAEAAELRRKSG